MDSPEMHRPQIVARGVGYGLRIAVASALLCGAGAALAKGCPDFRQNGEQRAYTSEALYEPQSIRAQAGGGLSLSDCAEVPGSGWLTERPDFTIEFSKNAARRRLEFRVNSACDATLLINSPTGSWHFDDDSNGNMDPKVRFVNAQAGVYDVWVGRIGSRELCDAMLILETFDP